MYSQKKYTRLRHSSPHLRNGFTLVEILAASAIMLIILVSVMGLTNTILNSFNSASNQLSANAEARQAFELLASDLESAIIKNDGKPWIEVVRETPTSSAISNVANLYFYSPTQMRPKNIGGVSTGTPINGDVCAVNYKICYQNPFVNPPAVDATASRNRYTLHRGLVDPEVTFSDFMGLTFANATARATIISSTWGSGNRNLLNADLTRTSFTNAANYTQQSFNIIASRVIDFEVSAIFEMKTISSGATDNVYVSSKDTPFTLPLVAQVGGVSSPAVAGRNSSGIVYNINPASTTETFTLKAIRISLTVINPEGEQILRFGTAAGGNATVLTDPLQREKYTETFTRVIPVTVSSF